MLQDRYKELSLRGKKKYYFQNLILIEYLNQLSITIQSTIMNLQSTLLIGVLMSIISAIQIENNSLFSNLQEKQNGASITHEIEITIQNAIDEGYKYYGQDLLNNAKYIKDKLSILYPAKWNVIIVTNTSEPSLNLDVGFTISNMSSPYRALWTSANQHEKGWTYLINKNIWTVSNIQTNITKNTFARGSGYSDQDVGAIKHIIFQTAKISQGVNELSLNTLKETDLYLASRQPYHNVLVTVQRPFVGCICTQNNMWAIIESKDTGLNLLYFIYR